MDLPFHLYGEDLLSAQTLQLSISKPRFVSLTNAQPVDREYLSEAEKCRSAAEVRFPR